ncbi:MAG: SpoIIE family protein phosphatase [Eubacteriales bacterium]
MSIQNQVQRAFLLAAAIGIFIFMFITLENLNSIYNDVSEEMIESQETITQQNTEDVLEISMELAEVKAQLNAEKINGDLTRLSGELMLLKESIESLYTNGGMVVGKEDIQRHSEYIVSVEADLTQEEIDETVAILANSVEMFDGILKIEENISLAYVVLENGMVFSSTDTFYAEVENADMRTRDWYTNAVDTGTVYWSELYQGTDDRSYVTISVPVYDQEGVFGVLAFDLRVSEISEMVLYQEDASVVHSFIVTQDNELLFSTDDLEVSKERMEFQLVETEITLGERDYGSYQNDEYIIGYAVIPETSWYLVNSLDYETVHEPVENVADTVATTITSLQDSLKSKTVFTTLVLALSAIVIVLYNFIASRRFAKKITNPIKVLEDGSTEIGRGNLDYVIPDLGEGEIGHLARNFNKMSTELKEYIRNISVITAEKERLGAELSVATNIQASMLPSIFPAFPTHQEFDIFASMTPAKEVGGDFYDFFLVDEDHLAMVMADVSGKGIPAALFMVISKTLLKNCAQTGISPHEVLEKVNNQLCEGNDAEMFVTVWLGIYEISTGHLRAANAGHEYPVIKRANGEFELVKDVHGFVLAGMEGVRYKEYELQLEEGDKLFVYTDGVAEATNASDELYGTDRLLDLLNQNKETDVQQLLVEVKADIDLFAGDAPQFDDITMLAFCRKEDEQ